MTTFKTKLKRRRREGALFLLFTIIAIFVYQVYTLRVIPGGIINLTIEKGEGITEIGQKLEKNGLIGNRIFFQTYVFLQGKAKKIKAGNYTFLQEITIPEIVKKLVFGEVTMQTITIPEGWGIIDIVRLLEAKQILMRTEFYEVSGFPVVDPIVNAANSSLADECGMNLDLLRSSELSGEFFFLQDKPPELNLEGYLFPDTYEIGIDESAEDIIRKMLANFDTKMSSDLRTEITRQEKTIFAVVTMASMLEKEVKTLEDKKIVAGILWKRLSAGMPLQVDATIIYSAGRDSDGSYTVDTTLCSEYNTYKHKGLPYGPISNPGLESIIAAIYPQKSAYWYYLSASDGTTMFSKTYEEHLYKTINYLR
ncbi:MAG: endolytic transglycosylase MltG [bacterium]